VDTENRLKKFFCDQDNLDAMYWLTQGLSYRDIGEKIGRPHSFIQRVNNFLRNHGLMAGGQWRVDVNALGMTKTFKFFDYSPDRPREVVENEDFLTYFADIKKGKSGHYVMFTFPNEIETKIGENISPYYYKIPQFKAPLSNNDLTLEDFTSVYKNENNENPLPPRGEAIDFDIIHIEIARYVELFGIPGDNEPTSKDTKKASKMGLNDINFSRLVDIIKDDIEVEGLKDTNVTYDIVRNRYNEMLEKNIIYPGFGIQMKEFGYVLSFCWINSKEIYRIIKTFSHFNVICALAYTQTKNKYLLHLQYPRNKEMAVFDILNDVDSQNEVFKILKVHDNNILPHPYYFGKEKRKKEIKN
jgi:hypothetical protein